MLTRDGGQLREGKGQEGGKTEKLQGWMGQERAFQSLSSARRDVDGTKKGPSEAITQAVPDSPGP